MLLKHKQHKYTYVWTHREFFMLLYMTVKNLIYFSIGQGRLEDHLDELIQKSIGISTDLATPPIMTLVGDKCKKPLSVECKPLTEKKKKKV